MAALRIVDDARVDTLYADLDRGLGAKTEVVVGNNTKLVRRYLPGVDAISIRLHNTDVVTVYRDNSIVFDTGGYVTVTTIERINHVAHKLGWRAYRKLGCAYMGIPYMGKLHSDILECTAYQPA